MSYQYKVKEKKVNLTGETQYKFFATPVSMGQVSTDEIINEIAERTTLAPSDLVGAITALSSIITEKIKRGYSVKLDRLGTFGLSITSDGFSDAAKCTPAKVKAKKVWFRADKRMKEAVSDTNFERYIHE
ncbi:MAG: HU family DNA-binding protein [Bacteroidales bacterium]|jgi:predicted histone-like DNA-binding protein|nr:HU family DNA-binding protein [Bacteroidales bacterium]